MPLSRVQSCFLQALGTVARGEELHLSLSRGEWQTLFQLAAQQHVLALLYEPAYQTEAAQQYPELFAAYHQAVVTQVGHQLARAADFRALYGRLRQRGLHPLVVKGQLCDRLYPSRCRRKAVDDDLLIPSDELAACHQALLELGLRTDTPPEQLAAADEISYFGDHLYIELHQRLFSSAPDAPDDMNVFFCQVHRAPVELDGYLSMPPQEHLLLLLLHAYKHFIYSGVGLRQVVDVGLWARAYNDQLDWELLRQQCRQVHAEVFAAALFRILRERLNLPVPGAWEAEEDVEPLLLDMLDGGAFGAESLSRLHTSTMTLNAIRASRTGQRSGLLPSVFPPRTYLQGRYPWLKRRPWLLPAAWLARLLHYLVEILRHPHNRPDESVKLARERIELLRYYQVME